MATLIAYSEASDGFIESGNSTYSAARAGTGTYLTAYDTSVYIRIGQFGYGGYLWVDEGFIQFDTSAIRASSTITNASLETWLTVDGTTTNFTAGAYQKDWGTSLTTADFVAGATDLTSTRMCIFDTSNNATVGAYFSWNNVLSDFVGNINKTGNTRMILRSSRQEAGNSPGGLGSEYIEIASNENASGTSHAPKITVTYTEQGFPQVLFI